MQIWKLMIVAKEKCIKFAVCGSRKAKQLLKLPAAYTHPDGAHVLLFGRPGLAAYPVMDPPDQIPHALGRGDDVERRRHGASLLEVADPQFAPCVLPLGVRPFLHRINNIRKSA